MAERIAYLEAIVGADITNFRYEMRRVRNDLGGLSSAFGAIQSAGRALTFGITAPIVGIGTAAVAAASGFDAAMRNIASISSDVGNNFGDISQRVMEFGASIRAGPTAAAEGLYTVFSAGVTDVEDAFRVMEVSVATAEAGLADLTTTTEALTSVWLAYGQSIPVERISDSITRMVQVGVGEMNEFTNALSLVIPAAAGAGIEFENMAGLMAFMTQRGFSASRAATSLNAAITGIVKPTEAMNAAMSALGVQGVSDLLTKFGSLDEAILALVGTTDGSAESINELWANVRGSRAVNAMVTDVDLLRSTMEEFNLAVDGATERARMEQMKSFAYQFDLLKAAVEAASIAFGQRLLPILTPIVQNLTDTFLKIQELDPAFLDLAIGVGAAAAAIGPLLWAVGALLSPVAVLTGAIVGLAKAFEDNFLGIRDTVEDAITNIIGDITPIQSAADTFIEEFFGEPDVADIEKQFSGWNAAINDALGNTEVITIDIPIKPGWGHSHMWQEHQEELQELFPTYEDFRQALVDSDQQFFMEGGVVTFEMPVGADITDATNPTNLGTQTRTIADRFKDAFDAAKPKFIEAFESIKTAFISFVNDTFIPEVNRIGGNVLDTIAGWFQAGNGTGQTPLYNAIQKMFKGDFEGAINDLIPGLGTTVTGAVGSAFKNLNDALPDVKSGLSNLISNIGDWLISTGVPTLSRAAGFLVGMAGVAIGQAFGALGGFLTGQGGGGGAGTIIKGFGDTVISPFMGGIGDAFSQAGIDENPIDMFFTSLASVIAGAAGIAMFGKALLGAAFGLKLGSTLAWALKGALLGGKLITGLAGIVIKFLNAGLMLATGGIGGLKGLMAIGTALYAGLGSAFLKVGALGMVNPVGALIAAALAGVGIAVLIEKSGLGAKFRTAFFNDLLGMDESAEAQLQSDAQAFMEDIARVFGLLPPLEIEVPVEAAFVSPFDPPTDEMGAPTPYEYDPSKGLLESMGLTTPNELNFIEWPVEFTVPDTGEEDFLNEISMMFAQNEDGITVSLVDLIEWETYDAAEAALDGIVDNFYSVTGAARPKLRPGAKVLSDHIHNLAKSEMNAKFNDPILDTAQIDTNSLQPLRTTFANTFQRKLPAFVTQGVAIMSTSLSTLSTTVGNVNTVFKKITWGQDLQTAGSVMAVQVPIISGHLTTLSSSGSGLSNISNAIGSMVSVSVGHMDTMKRAINELIAEINRLNSMSVNTSGLPQPGSSGEGPYVEGPYKMAPGSSGVVIQNSTFVLEGVTDIRDLYEKLEKVAREVG